MSQISKSTGIPEELIQETICTEHPRYRRATLLLFCASTFLFWAAMYLYVPILPAYTESMGASLSMVGAVIGSYAIAQVLIRAPIGIFADSLGRRKPFILGGLVFTSLGGLALAVAPNPWFLFAGRALTGVAAATWVVSSVFFVSYFPPERAARGIGIISFVNGAAIIAATSIGGQLAELFGPQSVFFIGALLGVLGVLFLLPIAETATTRRRSADRNSYLRVAVSPVLLIASLMSMLVHFASAASISSFTLVYAGRLGASSGDLGIVSAAFMGASMVATLLTVYLVEKRGYSFTIPLGAAIMGATLLATPLIGDLHLFEGIQLLTGTGRGLLNTALMALSITAIAPSQMATAMGVYQALYAIGMLLGPVLGGVVADTLGIGSVFYISGVSVLLAGAMAFLPNRIPRLLAQSSENG